MNIVLLGAPGAGKGTQAVVISKKYNIPHISTGEILRAHIKSDTDLGRQARSYVESGRLVPDELVIAMVKDRLLQPDCKRGFILDGFPRNVRQAEVLTDTLQELGKQIEYALNFDASEEVIISRLSGRRVCAACEAIFHIKNMPPQRDGLCDRCGGALIQRSDDSEATVRKRLRVYRETAEPLLAYYRERNVLVTVPADKDYREIEQLLVVYFKA